MFDLIQQMFSEPFMQRAFLAALMVAIVLSGLGVFVMLRNMAFIGDGIAHSSLAGIAIAIALGLPPIPVAIVWAVAMAIIISVLRQRTKISSDALIGIAFTSSLAIGIIVMNSLPGYRPELISYLFGSILGVQNSDLLMLLAATVIILIWFIFSARDLTFLSLSEESAKARGVKVELQEIILAIALAITTVLGVKLLGVILVSALLIIPASTAKILASSFKSYVVMTMVISVIISVFGLVISYLYDLPSGSTITIVAAGLFFLAGMVKKLKV